jgi:hypothetical protein
MKVKVPVHGMKEYRRSGDIAPLICYFGITLRWVVGITPWLLYPQGKNCSIKWIDGWVGPRDSLGILALARFRTLYRPAGINNKKYLVKWGIFQWYFCMVICFVVRTFDTNINLHIFVVIQVHWVLWILQLLESAIGSELFNKAFLRISISG